MTRATVALGIAFLAALSLTAVRSDRRHRRPRTATPTSLLSRPAPYPLASSPIRWSATTSRPRGAQDRSTDRYFAGPTIPGPTLVIKESDTAEVTLEHGVADSQLPVSIHVHGVHYKADSDGTMKVLNGLKDEAAFPGQPYKYKWTAAPGTAGAWAYHDHAFGNPMIGAEDKGLYGMLIVNPADSKVQAMLNGRLVNVDVADIKREFIL